MVVLEKLFLSGIVSKLRNNEANELGALASTYFDAFE